MGWLGKRRGRGSHECHELIQAIFVRNVKERDKLGDKRAGEMILK